MTATSGPSVDSLCGDFFRVTLRYESGDLTDCNVNGVPDVCDLASGVDGDCDANGRPDSCDVGAGPSVASVTASACEGQSATFGAPVTRLAVGGTSVTVEVIVQGDTDRGEAQGEFVRVAVGSGSVLHAGAACGQAGSYSFALPAEEFNALLTSDLAIPVTITAGPDADCSQCQASAQVRLTFVGVDPADDCNLNGTPDACDIASGTSPDMDGDGRPDDCGANPFDPDGDAVPTPVDNCPSVANPSQADADGDGIGDACDRWPNCIWNNEADCNPCVPGDVCNQACPDYDACACSGYVDSDGDGDPDCTDGDDDNDGVPDASDAFPLDPGESADTDGDGTGNNADSDDDADGFEDAADNCPLVGNDQSDVDGDGVGDACDSDADNDGVDDASDNCPSFPNPSQSDCDGNGIGDACDTSSIEPGPNLVIDGGFEGSQYDGSFVGQCYTSGGFTMAGWQHGSARTEDLFRNSADGKCFAVPFREASGQYMLSLQGSGCCNCDLNGSVWQPIATEAGRTYTLRMFVFLDIADAIRVSWGTQSAVFDAGNTAVDEWAEVTWTFDGTGSVEELRIESVGTTAAAGCTEAENAFVDDVSVTRDPLLVDCNGNGQQDLLEISQGTAQDCNSNCVPDSCEPDFDGDGFIDACDACPADAAPGCGGCPANECGGCGTPPDFDGDGASDCVDPDDDADGVEDSVDAFPFDPSESVDTDLDGVGDNADGDDDNDGLDDGSDGCPLDPAKSWPGSCGCGVPDTDSDGDGFADCVDNCPSLPNGQGDCDGDGEGDACEIAAGAGDCNLNGVPDACDIAAYLLEDCNSNGVGDVCEKQLWVDLFSGRMSPLGAGHPRTWTIANAAQAIDVVGLELFARGDLSSSLEYVDVRLGGNSFRAFNGAYETVDCVASFTFIPVQPDDFNAAIAADGSLTVSLQPSVAVDPLFCGGDTWIEVRLRYTGATGSDCNVNGVLDSCEIAAGSAADVDGNGIPDECLAPVPPCPADLDGDGVVGGGDLGLMLSAWGSAEQQSDMDGDGVTSGGDLGLLLSAWGPCAP